jgi:Cdc6-like AAA superfamily ATPase
MNPPTLTPEVLADLRRHNPFARPPVVKGQNIWGESFADVTSLNAHASEAVFTALNKLAAATSPLEKISSLVITASRGVGKSHLIRRIRQGLQTSGEAVFVYASADEYGDLDFINSGVLRSLASSLERPWSEGVSQWQTVAAAMVARAVQSLNSAAKAPSPVDLVNRFDQWVGSHLAKGNDLVSEITRLVSKLHPGNDPYILRAILWTLSQERGLLAVKWLAGEALETQDAADLRLPPNQKTDKEQEADAFVTLTKILSLLGEYRQVLICFDEMDNIVENKYGYSPAMVIVDLVKRLFDSIQQSETAQGILLVTLILPDTWQAIYQDSFASPRKICTASEKPIELEYINTTSIIELVSLWLQDFYRPRHLTPPTPVYPFTTEELVEYGRGKPLVREALQFCSTELTQKLDTLLASSLLVTQKLSPTERWDRADLEAQERFLPEYLEDNELIAEVVRFCLNRIPQIARLNGTAIENVVITGTEDITPKSKNNGYLHFKILGTEAGQPVRILVAVVQQTGGFSVGAAFKRLLDYETFGCDRSCVLREENRKLRRNWKAYDYYQELVKQGGEWVHLQAEHLKPLFALKYIYDNHEQFDLSHKRLDSFAEVQRRLSQNPLIREILSQPKGQMSETALEGDQVHHLYSEAEAQQIIEHLEDLSIPTDGVEMPTQLDLTALGVA